MVLCSPLDELPNACMMRKRRRKSRKRRKRKQKGG